MFFGVVKVAHFKLNQLVFALFDFRLPLKHKLELFRVKIVPSAGYIF